MDPVRIRTIVIDNPGAPRIAFIRGVFDFPTHLHGYVKLVNPLPAP